MGGAGRCVGGGEVARESTLTTIDQAVRAVMQVV